MAHEIGFHDLADFSLFGVREGFFVRPGHAGGQCQRHQEEEGAGKSHGHGLLKGECYSQFDFGLRELRMSSAFNAAGEPAGNFAFALAA